jgi:hypothetical protein
MLVALAMFCAMPAIAFAGTSQDDNTSGGDSSIDQNGTAGDGGGSGGSGSGGDGGGGGEDDEGGSGGDGDGGSGGDGDGGDVGQQAAICSQTTGDGDNDCEIDQSQSFGGSGGSGGSGSGGSGDGSGGSGSGGSGDGSGGGGVTSSGGGTGGGSVESVTLALTGFDAWVLALLGGLSLAGGLGLLVAQRRGRLNA